jgi:hypothetical protein
MAGNLPIWIVALAAVGIAGSAGAEGPIGTLQRGAYACELPGDASRQSGIPQPAAGFAIESSSRYSAPQGGGTYLRRGNQLVMTSGPRQGESYAIVSEGFLRRIERDRPGRLRCVVAKR